MGLKKRVSLDNNTKNFIKWVLYNLFYFFVGGVIYETHLNFKHRNKIDLKTLKNKKNKKKTLKSKISNLFCRMWF